MWHESGERSAAVRDHPLCIVCKQRLERSSHRAWNSGRVHNSCYQQLQRDMENDTDDAAMVAVPPISHKRRRESEPGECDRAAKRASVTAARAKHKAMITALNIRHDEAMSEEAEEDARRTPAQLKRRHYLQYVAVRCDRCNFPRTCTGRKGWNAKTNKHIDVHCNNYRWCTLNSFC